MNSLHRVLTGVVSIPLFICLVKLLSPFAFFIFIEAAVLICCIEFFRMADTGGISTEAFLGTAVAMMMCFSVGQSSYGFDFPVFNLFMLITLSLFVIPLSYMIRKKPVAHALSSVSATIAGAMLVGYLMGYQLLLRNEAEHGAALIFVLYFVIWGGDAGALCVGKSFGKHKITPVISPRKTIEGCVGGFAASLVAAVISHYWFAGFIPLGTILIIASVMNIIGQSGDFIESMFKRGADIKDSSSILPGHGGLLDRGDSILFAAPVLYYSYMLFI